jgi:hypothetical protein
MIRRGRAASWATLLSVTVAGCQPARQSHAGPESSSGTVVVGVLREDAVLVPFAAFDGETWIEGTAGRELAEWELLTEAGVRQAIRVTGPTRFQNHCTYGIGFRTDFRSLAAIVPDSYPVPYAGMAATIRGILQPVRRVATQADIQAIAQLLPGMFARLESDVWQTTRGSEYEPNLSGRLPVPTVSNAYSGDLPDGRQLFSFGARRDLPRSVRGEPLEAVTQVVGWLSRHGTDPLLVLSVKGSQSDIDGKGGDHDLHPMGALTVGDGTFWLGSADGYEWETYFVIEVTNGAARMLVEAEAGGC